MTDYDAIARAYAEDNEKNLLNAYYERPAMLGLAGDVAGRRVLDAGCGAGPLTAALRDRGAEVSGFDVSAGMVDLARERLGNGVDLRIADLAEPLPYEDEAFDDVVCSLALHYLEGWGAPLAELRRVLRPGGRLIVSLNHPFVYAALNPDTDYFATTSWAYDYQAGDQTITLTNWHRPLHAITDAVTAAGFRIARLVEPDLPADVPEDVLPPTGRKRFIAYLLLVLVKD